MPYGLLVQFIAFSSVTLSTATAIVATWTLLSNTLITVNYNNNEIDHHHHSRHPGCISTEEKMLTFKQDVITVSAIVVLASVLQLVASSGLLASAGREGWALVWSWAVATCLTTTCTVLSFIDVSSKQTKLFRDCAVLVNTTTSFALNLHKFYFIIMLFCVLHALDIFVLTLTFGVGGKLRNGQEDRPYQLLNV